MLMFKPEKKKQNGAYTLKCACLKRCPTLKIIADPTYFATPYIIYIVIIQEKKGYSHFQHIYVLAVFVVLKTN